MTSRAASPAPSTSDGTMSTGRTERQIRFAELMPKDVHVYESAPPSPRRKALALPPPSDADGPIISLGEWKGKIPSSMHRETADIPMSSPEPLAGPSNSKEVTFGEEQGTPEDIRRRFFPSADAHHPALEWIQNSNSPPSSSHSSALRFDLTGTPIPPAVSATLPTHLGLHHHAEGTHAGYTLDDIFLLSRSSVSAQRASMLGIMSGIALKLAEGAISELEDQKLDLRKRMLAAGLELISERGSLGVRGIHLVWACVVAWDLRQAEFEGVALRNQENPVLDSIQLDYLLPQISDILQTAALPSDPLSLVPRPLFVASSSR